MEFVNRLEIEGTPSEVLTALGKIKTADQKAEKRARIPLFVAGGILLTLVVAAAAHIDSGKLALGLFLCLGLCVGLWLILSKSDLDDDKQRVATSLVAQCAHLTGDGVQIMLDLRPPTETHQEWFFLRAPGLSFELAYGVDLRTRSKRVDGQLQEYSEYRRWFGLSGSAVPEMSALSRNGSTLKPELVGLLGETLEVCEWERGVKFIHSEWSTKAPYSWGDGPFNFARAICSKR